MAEFRNPQDVPPAWPDLGLDSGFNAMGRPVPTHRRQAGYEHCKAMGCTTEASWSAVNGMAEQLERDQPYEAMAMGTKYLDLTGTYRLMAVLLCAETDQPDLKPVKK